MSGIREWAARWLLPAGSIDAMVERSVDEAVDVAWPKARAVVEIWQADLDAVELKLEGGFWRADGLPVLTEVDLDMARRVAASMERSLVGALAVVAELERAE